MLMLILMLSLPLLSCLSRCSGQGRESEGVNEYMMKMDVKDDVQIMCVYVVSRFIGR
jgi:hypothetical protein